MTDPRGQASYRGYYNDLPIAELARAFVARAEEFGLIWRLRPGTVAVPGTGGQVRVTLDGDTVPINVVSLIGRMATGQRVMVIQSPPAAYHIVGFLGENPLPLVAGEAMGRPFLYVHPAATEITSTTLADIPGFRFPVAPNGVYIARARVGVDAPTSNDVKIRWTVPSGAQIERNDLGIPSTATGSNITANQVLSIRRSAGQDTNFAGFADSPSPGNRYNIAWMDFLVLNGPTAGFTQLQAAFVSGTGSGNIWQRSIMEVQRYR